MIIYYIFITHYEFSVLPQREGLSRRKSPPLILKDSDTVSQHCSLSDTWSFSTQGDSGTCCLRLELFLNWVSICAGVVLFFLFVFFFKVSMFYEGRELSQFCLPSVEKCFVLWLWVEVQDGLLWVFWMWHEKKKKTFDSIKGLWLA